MPTMQNTTENINLIRVHQAKGEFQAAEDILNNCLRNDEKNPELLSHLLHNHIMSNNLKNAIELLKFLKSLQISRPDTGWHEARILLKQKKPEDALRIATENYNCYPKDEDADGILGACYRANSDFKSARKFLNNAIEKNPKHAEALINRGLLNISENLEKAALSDLESAFKVKPHITEIWTLLLQLKMAYSLPEDTLLTLVKMLKIDSSLPDYFDLAIKINQGIKNAIVSANCFKQLVLIQPKRPDLLFNFAIALRLINDIPGSTKYFSQALELQPNSHQILFNLGLNYKRIAELPKAEEYYLRAIKINPEFFEAYVNLGRVLQLSKKHEHALKIYAKANKLKPDNASVYNNIGITLSEMQQNDRALIYYRKAIGTDPNYAEAYYNAGKVLLHDKPEEAITNFENALRLNPEFTDAQSELGRCLVKLGRANEGRSRIRKADGAISL